MQRPPLSSCKDLVTVSTRRDQVANPGRPKKRLIPPNRTVDATPATSAVAVFAEPKLPALSTVSTPVGPATQIEWTVEQSRLVGGSKVPAFNLVILEETLATVRCPGTVSDNRETRVEAVMSALRAFDPKDEIEGMLAAQAAALHFGAMECFRRAMLGGQPSELASKLRKDGANLARAMTDMVEALDRKRGKGPQVVRVERVVVHEGGQAIVGHVAAGVGIPGRGDG